MKLRDKDGHVLETANRFVIEQLLKHGAQEVVERTARQQQKDAQKPAKEPREEA